MIKTKKKIVRRYCPQCGKWQPIERDVLAPGCASALLTLFTAGMWVIVLSWEHGPFDHRCLVCGHEWQR